jgi:hypothetical protein
MRSIGGPRVPGSVHGSVHGSTHGSVHGSVPLSAGVDPTPESAEERKSRRRDRCWLMNILMAPCDCVEWMVSKWGKPSKDCMNCVKVVYWIVLIVGGIISTVVAVAPFL